MRANLLEPKVSLAALVLRLGLAAIFIVHGYFKVYVRDQLIPELNVDAQKALGVAELVCGVLLVLGLGSRLAAVALMVFQVAAIVIISGKYDMNVVVTAKGVDYLRVGPEYNLVLIAMCLSVLALGSGAVSIDHVIAGRLRRGKVAPAPAAAPAPAPPATSGVA
jgi:putative oxidoreductase